MDEVELMALPEITELHFTLFEWLDDRLIGQDKHSPSITFQVEVEDMPKVGHALTDFLEFNQSIENVLNGRQIGIDELAIFLYGGREYYIWWRPSMIGGLYTPHPIFKIHRNTLLSTLVKLKNATQEILGSSQI